MFHEKNVLCMCIMGWNGGNQRLTCAKKLFPEVSDEIDVNEKQNQTNVKKNIIIIVIIRRNYFNGIDSNFDAIEWKQNKTKQIINLIDPHDTLDDFVWYR